VRPSATPGKEAGRAFATQSSTRFLGHDAGIEGMLERANLGDGVGDLDQLGRRRTSGHDRMLMDETVLQDIENQLVMSRRPADQRPIPQTTP
jgi:hypothetical protein